jgi:hypothetical protein
LFVVGKIKNKVSKTPRQFHWHPSNSHFRGDLTTKLPCSRNQRFLLLENKIYFQKRSERYCSSVLSILFDKIHWQLYNLITKISNICRSLICD